MSCRRCRIDRPIRCRGLCFPCYNSPDAAQFPTLSRFGRRGPAGGKKDAEPTAELPATDSKVAALAARVRRGESLWHPHDAKRDLK